MQGVAIRAVRLRDVRGPAGRRRRERPRPAGHVALDGVTDRWLSAPRGPPARSARGVLVPERRSAGVTASAWKVSASAAARSGGPGHEPRARAGAAARRRSWAWTAAAAIAVADLPTPRTRYCWSSAPRAKGLSRLVREHCDSDRVHPDHASAVEVINAEHRRGHRPVQVARQRAVPQRRTRRASSLPDGGRPGQVQSGRRVASSRRSAAETPEHRLSSGQFSGSPGQ